ncbi:MAG: hypothetical protein AAFX54_17945 [Pseudomonadota bacterium]
MKNRRSIALFLRLFVFAFAVLFSTISFANDTIDLFARGHQLQIVPENGEAFTVEFFSDGTYKTSHGSSGKWKKDGDMLCTVRDSDAAHSCGVFPRGKKRGNAWTTKDARQKNVTVAILPPKARKVK